MHRRKSAISIAKVGAVLLTAGLVAAACGSGTPSASGKHYKSKSVKSARGASTTTSSTVATSGSTTTTAAGTSGSKSVTTTTAKKSSTGTSSTPGGSLSANPTSAPAGTLTGVGASSIQPFYGRVLYQYHADNSGVSVNFSPAGSGPGVTAIEQNTANFGQSEVPMTAAQQAASKGPVLQLPTDLGGVAISYHVSGVTSLKLDGPTLAQIYLRKITTWNDPAIAALNPGVNLPNENIVPVFRSDTSGPGYDLDQYLIDTSSAWTSAIGTSSPSTAWPNAGRMSGDSGQQLNAGVATYIQETEGAIGYVEYSYALEANFTNAQLKSHDGTWVSPSVSTIANAGAAVSGISPTNFNVVYAPGGSSYPLANYSWALIYQKQSNTDIGIDLGKLFQWITTSGQSYSTGLGYAPLPASIVALAHSTLLELQTATGQALFTS